MKRRGAADEVQICLNCFEIKMCFLRLVLAPTLHYNSGQMVSTWSYYGVTKSHRVSLVLSVGVRRLRGATQASGAPGGRSPALQGAGQINGSWLWMWKQTR